MIHRKTRLYAELCAMLANPEKYSFSPGKRSGQHVFWSRRRLLGPNATQASGNHSQYRTVLLKVITAAEKRYRTALATPGPLTEFVSSPKKKPRRSRALRRL